MGNSEPDELREQIAARLSGGDRRSTGAADGVAAEAASDPSLISVLAALMRHADPIVRMRAADALEKPTREQPDLLAPFVDHLIADIGAVPQQEVRWHVALLIPRLPLDGAQRGVAVELLKSYLPDNSRIVVVEALTALARLAEHDQALRGWLLSELERAVAVGVPSVRARARRLLPDLDATFQCDLTQTNATD